MRFLLTICLLCCSFILQAKELQTGGKVCPHPAKPCPSGAYEFQPHELTFTLPAKMEWQNGHRSAEFYAVILRSMKAIPVEGAHGDAICQGFIEETERLSVQAKFPDNKVFTTRNGCPSMILYSNTDDKFNFIAVYGGENKAEATKILEKAKSSGFADASLRKMQVIIESGD